MNTQDQQKAIDLIKQGKNVFVTGSGGVGKSWVIKQIADSSSILVAPTGVAAINIGGATCHSVFSLPFGLVAAGDEFKISTGSRKLFSSNQVKRIIIDEIGMLRADYLDLIDNKLKLIRRNNKPFGGIQVIVGGDFYQLEPIVSEDEQEYFREKYDSPFAFSAKCWDFITVELTEVKRQTDTEQINLLNAIRKDTDDSDECLEKIISMAKPYENCSETLHLCAYNNDAAKINKYWFTQIDQPAFTYTANYTSNWGKQHPVPERVMVKKGSKVLICANDPNKAYVNGDRGVVIDYTPTAVIVKLDTTGNIVNVVEHTWEKIKYQKVGSKIKRDVVGTFSQIPLRMGWAVSIHKSQGMTLDKAAIDVGKGCFGHGQLYVALSRIKDLTQLSFVRNVDIDNLIVREEVKKFYEQE